MNKSFEKWLHRQLKRIRKKYLKFANNDDYYLTMCILSYNEKGRKKSQDVIMANNRSYNKDKEIKVEIMDFARKEDEWN